MKWAFSLSLSQIVAKNQFKIPQLFKESEKSAVEGRLERKDKNVRKTSIGIFGVIFPFSSHCSDLIVALVMEWCTGMDIRILRENFFLDQSRKGGSVSWKVCHTSTFFLFFPLLSLTQGRPQSGTSPQCLWAWDLTHGGKTSLSCQRNLAEGFPVVQRVWKKSPLLFSLLFSSPFCPECNTSHKELDNRVIQINFSEELIFPAIKTSFKCSWAPESVREIWEKSELERGKPSSVYKPTQRRASDKAAYAWKQTQNSMATTLRSDSEWSRGPTELAICI